MAWYKGKLSFLPREITKEQWVHTTFNTHSDLSLTRSSILTSVVLYRFAVDGRGTDGGGRGGWRKADLYIVIVLSRSGRNVASEERESIIVSLFTVFDIGNRRKRTEPNGHADRCTLHAESALIGDVMSAEERTPSARVENNGLSLFVLARRHLFGWGWLVAHVFVFLEDLLIQRDFHVGVVLLDMSWLRRYFIGILFFECWSELVLGCVLWSSSIISSAWTIIFDIARLCSCWDERGIWAMLGYIANRTREKRGPWGGAGRGRRVTDRWVGMDRKRLVDYVVKQRRWRIQSAFEDESMVSEKEWWWVIWGEYLGVVDSAESPSKKA